MAITRNALLRIKILDRLIGAGGYQRQELHRKLNENLFSEGKPSVSIETMDGDIRAMRNHFQAPIECTRIWGYSYSVEGFSIFVEELSAGDIQDLEFSLDLMEAEFGSLPQVRTALEVMKRLYGKQVGAVKGKKVVFASSEREIVGGDHVKELHMAIVKKVCLSVYVSDGDGKQKKFRLSPYGFVRNAEGLDVVGFCADAEKIVVLPVSSVCNIEDAIGLSYRSESEFDMENYLAGRNSEEELVYVCLKPKGYRPEKDY